MAPTKQGRSVSRQLEPSDLSENVRISTGTGIMMSFAITKRRTDVRWWGLSAVNHQGRVQMGDLTE